MIEVMEWLSGKSKLIAPKVNKNTFQIRCKGTTFLRNMQILMGFFVKIESEY